LLKPLAGELVVIATETTKGFNQLNVTIPSDASTPEPAAPVAKPASGWRRIGIQLVAALDWVFGLLTLIVALSALAVVPGLNFLSLGYLLHASGEVARTGRFRAGLVGIRRAVRLGHVIVGVWLVLLPVRLAAGLAEDAALVSPGGTAARTWQVAVAFFAALAIGQIAWAGLRGARLGHFLWPAPVRLWRWLAAPEPLPGSSRSLAGYVAGLRLPYLFWLGFRGFVGALLWLAAPVGLLLLAAQLDAGKGGGLLALLGGGLLAAVVPALPFLQVRFAVENRFRAFGEVGVVRRHFRRAPLAFAVALFVTLLFALPLYLLKIELPPRELAWLPSLVFVLFIFPARLLAGWAWARAARHERPRGTVARWAGRLAIVPVVGFYVLLVYATQYLAWNGTLGLLEQHAFLVPAPLLHP
jgi:hypothetical protein